MNVRKGASEASYWLERMQVAQKLWRSLRADETITHGQSNSEEFSFSSIKALSTGIESHSDIQALKVDDDTWCLRVDVALVDYRVFDLSSFANGWGAPDRFMTFVPYLALQHFSGTPISPLPTYDLGTTDYELMQLLREGSREIDLIWTTFGGYDVKNFGSLALWMMEHKEKVGLHLNDVGGIFAAFVYGDRALSEILIRQLECHWEERARREPGHPGVQSAATKVRECLARVRSIIK